MLFLLLYVAALICFLLAAFNVTLGRVNLVALGLAFMVLVPVLTWAQRV